MPIADVRIMPTIYVRAALTANVCTLPATYVRAAPSADVRAMKCVDIRAITHRAYYIRTCRAEC